MQSYPKIQRKDLVKNELDIPEIFYLRMQSYPKIQRKGLVKNELDIPEIFYFLSEFCTHFIVKV